MARSRQQQQPKRRTVNLYAAPSGMGGSWLVEILGDISGADSTVVVRTSGNGRDIDGLIGTSRLDQLKLAGSRTFDVSAAA